MSKDRHEEEALEVATKFAELFEAMLKRQQTTPGHFSSIQLIAASIAETVATDAVMISAMGAIPEGPNALRPALNEILTFILEDMIELGRMSAREFELEDVCHCRDKETKARWN